MTRLRIFSADDATAPLATHADPAAIAAELGALGARFEQWQASQPVAPGDPPEAVIAAYRGDIDRLMREEGYRAVDVVSIAPDHPERAALRQKFLGEHTHAEDEVRFFVAGSGQFWLHVGERVYELLCQAGDLVRVPDRTPHWFDMGERPSFVAIRLFTNPEGWVAEFTGNAIAGHFPLMEPQTAA